MKYIKTFSKDTEVSQVALGCMRIGNMTDKEADIYLSTAVECGYNYFDHADIYGGGRCEEVFGAALKRNSKLRDKIIIQTKCGIRKGMYDFSKEHILSSVEGSLRRLGLDSVDVLLLHRPDLLMEPDEVAEAFDELEKSGKVRHFGVSNHSAPQIELLKTSVKQELSINQMQLSIATASMISSGANVNLCNEDGVNRDGYLRDYCRLNGITIQPWSPLQHGFIEGSFSKNEKYAELNRTIGELAEKYGITETGMAIAWLLRLPDKMQPVVGSTNIERIKAVAEAADIEITREDWYKIYLAAGYRLP
ncbi:MAG: aldo/keto reductase family oxidoreductase [Ruminococcaceae bacterium]|nr:aldo/keto reductase family oxidoreductase [Oscillospiraceae bacterium]